jgi:pimeloyl-[acyl-carrier protein] methyl ester esterase
MRPVTAIAYHGWGFDRSIWSDWQTQFMARGWQFWAGDRGYFGEACSPVWQDAEAFKVLLVHSLGLHFCDPVNLKQADLLIIFNGFLSFHPVERIAKKRSQRILQQMIAKFQTQPRMVLAEFHHNCYLPDGYSPERSPQLEQTSLNLERPMNLEQLLTDLQFLDTSLFDQTLLQTVPQIMICNSKQDCIIPTAAQIEPSTLHLQGQQHSQHNQHNQHNQQLVTTFTIETAGHALPFTQFADCWAIFVGQFIRQS